MSRGAERLAQDQATSFDRAMDEQLRCLLKFFFPVCEDRHHVCLLQCCELGEGANQSYMLGVVVYFGGCGRKTDSLKLVWAT